MIHIFFQEPALPVCRRYHANSSFPQLLDPMSCLSLVVITTCNPLIFMPKQTTFVNASIHTPSSEEVLFSSRNSAPLSRIICKTMAGNPLQIVAQSDSESTETSSILPLANTPVVNIAAPRVMASEEHPKRPKDKPATDALSTFSQHMTTGAHACILLFVILIIYFCFSGNFEFFTWHPLLLSIGWMFLMTEAVLTLSKDNIFTGTLPKKVRVRLHWVFLTIAVILIFSGFLVAYINKNYLNKPHFKTWHAFFGLIGVICSAPTCLDGIGALYHGDLRHYINPRINKFIHITSGVTTVTFGGFALILSAYTNWFAKHSDRNIVTFILGVALATYPVAWTLIKPATTCLKHVKKIMKLE